MKVIILAGGLGTRLREETEFRPKPMVEVGGRPVLWHIMKNLSHYGLSDFIVATGYKSGIIKEYFLNYAAWNNDFTVELGRKDELVFHGAHDEADWTVTVTFTGEDTMTGGRVLKAAKFLDDERFLVLYGDSLADVNIHSLVDFHVQSKRFATVTTVQPTSRFGVMDVQEDGKVVAFAEKPKLDGWINAGFFVMEQEVLEYLDESSILEERPLVALAADEQLSAYRHDGFWQPMDTFREARQLNDYWESGNPPWKVW